jgi:hypothetical protein
VGYPCHLPLVCRHPPGYLSPATESYRQSYRKTSPGYDENNQVEFEPDPNPVGNQPSSVVRPTASLIQEGNSPTALTPGTATQPTVIPHASETPPMASDQMNHGKIPGSPQSPVLDSPSPRIYSSSHLRFIQGQILVTFCTRLTSSTIPELLVQFLRNEAARETQGYKRPSEEPDP